MSNVAPSPEQGQLASVRSRNWIVTEVARSKLPLERLQNGFNASQHLITSHLADQPGARVVDKTDLPGPTGFNAADLFHASLDAMRWVAALVELWPANQMDWNERKRQKIMSGPGGSNALRNTDLIHSGVSGLKGVR